MKKFLNLKVIKQCYQCFKTACATKKARSQPTEMFLDYIQKIYQKDSYATSTFKKLNEYL